MKKARYFYIITGCGKISKESRMITGGSFPPFSELSKGLTGGNKDKLPILKFLHEFKSRQDFVDFCGDDKLCNDFDKLDGVKTKNK